MLKLVLSHPHPQTNTHDAHAPVGRALFGAAHVEDPFVCWEAEGL